MPYSSASCTERLSKDGHENVDHWVNCDAIDDFLMCIAKLFETFRGFLVTRGQEIDRVVVVCSVFSTGHAY
jgi:hypothetical protein